MRVLSLFDGISCGRVALQRAGQPKDMDEFFDKVWDDIYDACYRCDEK